MKLIRVTLGAGATQISTTPLPFSWMAIADRAGADCAFGDSTVTSSTGIPIVHAGAPLIVAPGIPGFSYDASQCYLAGTQSQVIDVVVL